jgi:hypothetical protein
LWRVVALTPSDLLQQRPSGAVPVIKDDSPNERGEPNHADRACHGLGIGIGNAGDYGAIYCFALKP